MVVTFTKDLESQTVKHDFRGVIIERKLFASCDGPAASAYDTQVTVLNDGGCPQLGDAYPGAITNYLSCVERTIQSVDAMSHWVTCVYAVIISQVIPTTVPLIEIGATIQDQQSNIDGSGAAVTVTYAAAGAYTLNAGEENTQGGTFSKGVPVYTIKATRMETAEPGATADANVGYVSSANAKIGKTTYSTGTLLCRAINAVPQQGTSANPLIYTVTYEFQFNPNGWTLDIAWVAQDGHIPSDSVKGGRGYNNIQPYPTVDFSTLNLNT